MGRKVERIWPRAVQTVGAMRDAGIRIKARYYKCENTFKVDLDILALLHGTSYSLINRRGACRLVGCDGSCVFLYRLSDDVPWRPLAD